MGLEVQEKELVYVRVDPDNAQQIEDASLCLHASKRKFTHWLEW